MGRLYAAVIVKAAKRAPVISAPHAAGERGAPTTVAAVRAAPSVLLGVTWTPAKLRSRTADLAQVLSGQCG